MTDPVARRFPGALRVVLDAPLEAAKPLAAALAGRMGEAWESLTVDSTPTTAELDALLARKPHLDVVFLLGGGDGDLRVVTEPAGAAADDRTIVHRGDVDAVVGALVAKGGLPLPG